MPIGWRVESVELALTTVNTEAYMLGREPMRMRHRLVVILVQGERRRRITMRADDVESEAV